ncbi:MAG TPA: hypothetical protein VLR27_01320 [Acidimicrobiales bacterium]|nr:hypothetical protein [Acidimicrobiales bacterium]
MDSNDQAPRRPAKPEDDVLGAVVALCRGLDDAATAQEILRRALPIVRSVLGDRVAFDLRAVAPNGGSSGAADVVVPLQADGRHFGDLRASGIDARSTVAHVFASAAGHVIGTALLLHQERAERAGSAASTTDVLSHRLRGALATIGVAASTLRVRGGELEPAMQLQLLLDIEANVAALRDVVDALGTGTDAPGGHDG